VANWSACRLLQIGLRPIDTELMRQHHMEDAWRGAARYWVAGCRPK